MPFCSPSSAGTSKLSRLVIRVRGDALEELDGLLLGLALLDEVLDQRGEPVDVADLHGELALPLRLRELLEGLRLVARLHQVGVPAHDEGVEPGSGPVLGLALFADLLAQLALVGSEEAFLVRDVELERVGLEHVAAEELRPLLLQHALEHRLRVGAVDADVDVVLVLEAVDDVVDVGVGGVDRQRALLLGALLQLVGALRAGQRVDALVGLDRLGVLGGGRLGLLAGGGVRAGARCRRAAARGEGVGGSHQGGGPGSDERTHARSPAAKDRPSAGGG
jgi:hypothetical protein